MRVQGIAKVRVSFWTTLELIPISCSARPPWDSFWQPLASFRLFFHFCASLMLVEHGRGFLTRYGLSILVATFPNSSRPSLQTNRTIRVSPSPAFGTLRSRGTSMLMSADASESRS